MSEEAEVAVTTDETILNSIGEGDEPSTSESTEQEDTGTAQDSATETSATGSEHGTEGSDDQQQQRQAGGPQDLVDANGNLIAAGGKERRFYETAQRERGRAEGLQKELDTVKSQLQAVNDAGTLGTQYNLSPEELTTGAQLIAAYKNNPVEAIQYMLTQAQSNGYNVDNITGGGATDMNAVKQMLDNAIAPLVQDRQEKVDQQAANERATEIYNDFMTRYPDAAVHENSLSRLLQQEPNLSIEAAYYKLQSFFSSRGLDWTKSLETLQHEQQAQKQASVNTQPQPPEGGSIPTTNVTDTPQVADVSTSTDDIIRQAMAEAGIN